MEQQKSRIVQLKAIRIAISDCNKDVPINGALEVITGIETALGQTSAVFSAIIVARLNQYPKDGTICHLVSGNSTFLDGASGSTHLEPPTIIKQSVIIDGCFLKFNGECLKKETGYFVVFQSFGGTQNPGTCEPSAKCDVNAASTALSAQLAAMNFAIVGQGEDCA